MKKKLLASFLTIVMLLGVMMTSVFAETIVDKNSLCSEGHVHDETCGKCSHEHDSSCYPEEYVKSDWVLCEKNKTCNNYYKDPQHSDDHVVWLWDDCILGTFLNAFYWTMDFKWEGYYRYVGQAWNCKHTHDANCFSCGHLEGDGSGHHVWDDGVVETAATCTTVGSMKYTCQNKDEAGNLTGHIYYETIPVDPDAHAWGKWSINPPTKDEAGSASRTCTLNREHTESYTLPKLPYEDGEFKNQNGYKFNVIQEPTCTETGLANATYTYNEIVIQIENIVIPALGHKWGEGVVTTPATCTTEGVMTYTCERGCTKTEPVAIDKEAHKWGEWVTKPAPTKDKEGTATRTCEYNKDHTESYTLPKLPANPGNEEFEQKINENEKYTYVVTTPATCEKPGEGKFTYTKTVNGEIDTEIQFTVEIPALGHDWKAWVIDPAPTKDKEGTATRTCNRDATHVETKTLPKLPDTPGNEDFEQDLGNGEKYTYVVKTPATCEGKGQGELTYTKTTEDETITVIFDVEILPLGHIWGDWKVTKRPTYSADGEARRDCDRTVTTKDGVWVCEEYETKRLDRLEDDDYDYNRTPAKPATSSKVKGLNTTDHIAYVAGYPDGTVRPTGNITRAEMAAIFCNLMTEDYMDKYYSKRNPYLDVDSDAWYNPYVSTMYKAGAIKDSEDYFRPNEPITRAELAVMAAQFATTTTNKASTFSDVSKNYWAADEIALVQKLGWISGYPDGTFRPDNNITRAEAMAIINNMLERAVEEEHMLKNMIKWIDNPSTEWYYEIVQEATNGHTYKRTSDKVGGNDYYYERWIKLTND